MSLDLLEDHLSICYYGNGCTLHNSLHNSYILLQNLYSIPQQNYWENKGFAQDTYIIIIVCLLVILLFTHIKSHPGARGVSYIASVILRKKHLHKLLPVTMLLLFVWSIWWVHLAWTSSAVIYQSTTPHGKCWTSW